MSLQDLLNENKNDRMTLQDAINHIAESNELNLTRLANMLGKKATQIWQYSKGKTKTCGIDTAKTIYEKFGIVVKPFHKIELTEGLNETSESSN